MGNLYRTVWVKRNRMRLASGLGVSITMQCLTFMMALAQPPEAAATVIARLAAADNSPVSENATGYYTSRLGVRMT